MNFLNCCRVDHKWVTRIIMVKMKLKPCQHTNAEEHETGNSKAARYVSALKVSRHEVKYQLNKHKSMVIQIYNSIYISEEYMAIKKSSEIHMYKWQY